MRLRGSTTAILILAMAGILFAEAGDGKWLLKVPAKDRGAKIFAEHCAPCHGEDAAGKAQGKHIRPSLHADRVKQAAPGELFWLLTNGSQKNGMPSWSRLPDAQRWQLITYLKSLP